jgi:broad specificity phosphatase PhoE
MYFTRDIIMKVYKHEYYGHSGIRMTVYICRHGDKQSNDHYAMLSDVGKTQANDLGTALCDRGVRKPHILSSPYGRCLQTATAISQQVGGVPILVEYGLSEGPLHEPNLFPPLHSMKRDFPFLNLTYVPQTPEPHNEYNQRDVLPRCLEMADFITAFFANKQDCKDVVIVTHGTVAVGVVAAMVKKVYEPLDNCIQKVQGCVPAGYYQLMPSMCDQRGLTWTTDFQCICSHITPEIQVNGTETTPICFVPCLAA